MIESVRGRVANLVETLSQLDSLLETGDTGRLPGLTLARTALAPWTLRPSGWPSSPSSWPPTASHRRRERQTNAHDAEGASRIPGPPACSAGPRAGSRAAAASAQVPAAVVWLACCARRGAVIRSGSRSGRQATGIRTQGSGLRRGAAGRGGLARPAAWLDAGEAPILTGPGAGGNRRRAGERPLPPWPARAGAARHRDPARALGPRLPASWTRQRGCSR